MLMSVIDGLHHDNPGFHMASIPSLKFRSKWLTLASRKLQQAFPTFVERSFQIRELHQKKFTKSQ